MKKTIIDIIDNAIHKDNWGLIENAKKLAFELRGEGDYNTANYILNTIGMYDQKISPGNKVVIENNILRIAETSMIKVFNPEMDTTNLVNILTNTNELKKIGPLKCLISGRPGTGKTSFVYYLANKSKRKLYYIKSTDIISHLLGNTQKNLDELRKDIINSHKNSIILIDELDSILGNRNDDINNEYKRMVGDFNLLLDSLPKETVIIAVSNKINMVDEASLRRFNVFITMDEVSPVIFIEQLKHRCVKLEIPFDTKLIKKIISILKNEASNILSFSQIDIITSAKFILGKNIYQVFLEQLGIKIDIKHFIDNLDFTYSEISKILEIADKTVKMRYNNGNN